MVGPNLVIECNNHKFNRVGIPMYKYRDDKINGYVSIEDDVWIGANVTILKNITIREGAVVGACSLVTKDILPYSISYGIPAKAHWMRFEPKELREHLSKVNSKYNYNN